MANPSQYEQLSVWAIFYAVLAFAVLTYLYIRCAPQSRKSQNLIPYRQLQRWDYWEYIVKKPASNDIDSIAGLKFDG